MSDTTPQAPPPPPPEKPSNAGRNAAIGVAVVALGWTALQTSAANDQTNIDNLPALEARLGSVEAEVEIERTRSANLTDQVSNLSAQLAGTPSRDSVQQEFDDFQEQLDRRDAEQSSDLDATVQDLNGDIAVLRGVMGELEADLEFLERVSGFGPERAAEAGG